MTELRTTWRQLFRAPAHVATVVASLGIAMAVCGAMFSALNVLIFSDVPGVVDRNSLVRIRWAGESASFTAAEFDALAAGVGDDIDGCRRRANVSCPSSSAARPPARAPPSSRRRCSRRSARDRCAAAC